MPQRILRVDYKSVAPGHEGFARELGNDRRQLADGRLALDPAAENACR